MGFFYSTRRVIQGDPLSPALFILAADAMARSLNQSVEDSSFIGYGMPKMSSELNHLAYADDTIIFTSSNEYSIKKIMQILKKYEVESGQKINMDKSFFYMHQNTLAVVMMQVEQATGMSRGVFYLNNLDCPLSHLKRKKEHYS